MNNYERMFADRIESEGKTWFFEPKRFPFSTILGSYCPDFYVVEDECYYEIISTRQAYSANRDKYEQFRIDYPRLRFEIIFMNGCKAGKKRERRSVLSQCTKKEYSIDRLSLARSMSGLTMRELGSLAGVSDSTVARIFHNQSVSHRSVNKVSKALRVPLEEVWTK